MIKLIQLSKLIKKITKSYLLKRLRPPLLITTLLLTTILFTFSFVWGVFTVREKIFPYKLAKSIYAKFVSKPVNRHETDKLWAKKISEGGYILHFRHAQREKWHDVTAFDAYEYYTRSNAENSSYAKATCLTAQGIEEAKLIGEVFKINSVKVDKVISSPSCRAIQTARYAFGKIDFVDISLLHRTAMMEDQWSHFAHQLRKLFLKHLPSPTTNVIFVGHGGTLQFDAKIIFEADETGGIDDRQETGFVVIENVKGLLYVRYRFNSIRDYVRASLRLPVD